jgi:hypothetical protein
MQKMSALAPGEDEQPRPAAAWKTFQTRHAQPAQQPVTWRFTTMFTRRLALTLGVLLLVVAAFSLPPVRAAASDFLGLFRVGKFAPISISPQQLALLEQIAEQGLHPGELVMTQEPGEPQAVMSVAEAQALVDFRPRQIPSLGEPASVMVEQGGSGHLVVDLEQMRAILGMAGVDPLLLPDSLNGAQINVVLHPGIVQSWADDTTLLQMRSPEVDYPDDVDPAVVGEALMQALGMTPDEAQRLSRAIDWSNTLVLPIPTNVATFSEVRVGMDGSGLALTSVEGHGNALLWQDGGFVYLLTGAGSTDDLLDLAGRME